LFFLPAEKKQNIPKSKIEIPNNGRS
jgi:hypothetical protein